MSESLSLDIIGGTTGYADPADLTWPPTLPFEIALKTASHDEIRREYGYSEEEWAALPQHPLFVADLAAAVEAVKKDGMSFKIKARLQAEELLKQSWRLIHSPGDEVPPSVKADLIKATMRWAGYDAKDTAAPTNANAFQININLGDR